MSGSNGHQNGHLNGSHSPNGTPQSPGGEGRGPESQAEKALSVPGGNRHALQLLCRAIDNGHAAEADMSAVVAYARKILRDPGTNRREKLRAGELLEKLTAARHKAAVELDRILRLEAGAATENIGHLVMVVEEATPPANRVTAD